MEMIKGMQVIIGEKNSEWGIITDFIHLNYILGTKIELERYIDDYRIT